MVAKGSVDLHATGVEHLVLPSGIAVAVPKATPQFLAWGGQPPGDTYGGKQILDFKGRPAFAELAILWALCEQGWEGVWIDTYRRAFRTGFWGVAAVEAPPERSGLL